MITTGEKSKQATEDHRTNYSYCNVMKAWHLQLSVIGAALAFNTCCNAFVPTTPPPPPRYRTSCVFGVLSRSSIVNAANYFAKSKKRPPQTAASSLGGPHFLMGAADEALYRQHRIVEALERELQKPDDNKEKSLHRKEATTKRLQEVSTRSSIDNR